MELNGLNSPLLVQKGEMLSLFFFFCAWLFALIHFAFTRARFIETLLAYTLLFSIGVMSLFAAYGHIFMGPEIAESIGWAPGSPFQYEMGIANLSYGVLGVLSFWKRGSFWDATVIGWSVLVLGCFVGHLINFYGEGNRALFNIGYPIWFFDLFLPLFASALLIRLRR